MITALPSSKHTDWKTLYTAAILETKKSVIPYRVSKAEQAVLVVSGKSFTGTVTPKRRTL